MLLFGWAGRFWGPPRASILWDSCTRHQTGKGAKNINNRIHLPTDKNGLASSDLVMESKVCRLTQTRQLLSVIQGKQKFYCRGRTWATGCLILSSMTWMVEKSANLVIYSSLQLERLINTLNVKIEIQHDHNTTLTNWRSGLKQHNSIRLQVRYRL